MDEDEIDIEVEKARRRNKRQHKKASEDEGYEPKRPGRLKPYHRSKDRNWERETEDE